MVNTILAKRINHIVAKGGQSCLAKGVKVAWLFQALSIPANAGILPVGSRKNLPLRLSSVFFLTGLGVWLPPPFKAEK